MIINKKDVIKALKTEKLDFGNFFHGGQFIDLSSCAVCAVGAIIRSKFKKKINKYHALDLTRYAKILCNDQYADEHTEILLNEKNYLGALSNYFEELGSNKTYVDGFTETVTDEERAQLVEFVRKNFPTRFKVQDIGSVS